MNQKLPVPKKKKHVNLGIESCRLGQCEDYLGGRYVPPAKDTEVQRYLQRYTGTQVHVRNMYVFVKIGTSYVVPTCMCLGTF